MNKAELKKHTLTRALVHMEMLAGTMQLNFQRTTHNRKGINFIQAND